MALDDLSYPAQVPQLPPAQANFQEILRRWTDLKAMETRLAAVEPTLAPINAGTQVDVVIPPSATLVTIDYALEFTALAELRMTPNALATAIYSDIRDGSYETQVPAAVAVAASGGVSHNNGLRLAFPPQLSVAGGVQVTGRATFAVAVMTVASATRRACIAQAAVTSTTGSGNHVIELQNIASLFASNVPITSLRFSCNGGTMTGLIKVTKS